MRRPRFFTRMWETMKWEKTNAITLQTHVRRLYDYFLGTARTHTDMNFSSWFVAVGVLSQSRNLCSFRKSSEDGSGKEVVHLNSARSRNISMTLTIRSGNEDKLNILIKEIVILRRSSPVHLCSPILSWKREKKSFESISWHISVRCHLPYNAPLSRNQPRRWYDGLADLLRWMLNEECAYVNSVAAAENTIYLIRRKWKNGIGNA